MPLYEHVFLARQDVSAQQVEDMTAQYKGILEGLGATIARHEYWGVKSLSFRMNKNRKAHYSLMTIDGPAAAIAEMERQMKINEDVLRFMTVRVEEVEEGPSVMMQKRDRDERRDRERFGGEGGGGRFGGGERRGGGRRRDEDSTDDSATEE